MELANQPAQNSESIAVEHHEFYLPAMPTRRLVGYVQRFFARLNPV